MDSTLLYNIFVELAVLEGKRDQHGKWKTKDPAVIDITLARAKRIIERLDLEDTQDNP